MSNSVYIVSYKTASVSKEVHDFINSLCTVENRFRAYLENEADIDYFMEDSTNELKVLMKKEFLENKLYCIDLEVD